MNKTFQVIMATALLLGTLSGCSLTTRKDVHALNTADSYGTAKMEQPTSEIAPSMMDTISDDYITFDFAPEVATVTNLSDEAIAGSYYVVEPLDGILTSSAVHMDVYGGERIVFPENYTKETWVEYAKELAASYYEDPTDLQIRVIEQNYTASDMGIILTVAAKNDIPETTFDMRVANGETGSLVAILSHQNIHSDSTVQYEQFQYTLNDAQAK